MATRRGIVSSMDCELTNLMRVNTRSRRAGVSPTFTTLHADDLPLRCLQERRKEKTTNRFGLESLCHSKCAASGKY